MYKVFFLSLIFSFSILNAQTAEDIINQHFAATGGLENWNNLNSILIEGEVSVDISDVVPIKIEHKRPYFKRVSYVVEGKEQLSEGFDGKKAFTYNSMNQGFMALKDYQPDAFETDILNYKKKGFKAELVGKESINGKNAFKIKLIKNTITDYYWFDAESFQLLKEQNQFETINYSDFRQAKGLTFAYRMEATPVGGKEYVVIFNKVVPNANFGENRFKFN